MRNKKKLMAAMGLLTLSMVMSPVTGVLAYSGEDADVKATDDAATDKTAKKVVEETGADGKPFSIEGNGQVLDQSDDDSKEFITITTKNNQTFFLVIDHASASDNAYMLSMIDENDLKEFLDDEGDEGIELPGSKLALGETGDLTLPNDSEDNTVTDENQNTDDSEENTSDDFHAGSLLIIVLVILAVTMLTGYYIKVYRPRKELQEDVDEGLEDGLVISSGSGMDQDTVEADDNYDRPIVEANDDNKQAVVGADDDTGADMPEEPEEETELPIVDVAEESEEEEEALRKTTETIESGDD